MYQETGLFCKSCRREVLARRPGPAHLLHLLLSIFTMGLWLPIWLLSCVRIGGWRCSFCGKRIGPSVANFTRW